MKNGPTTILNEPSDDQVHRYVQRLLQNRKRLPDENRRIAILKEIIADIWALRERDREEFETKLGGQRVSAEATDTLVRKMRDYGALR